MSERLDHLSTVTPWVPSARTRIGRCSLLLFLSPLPKYRHRHPHLLTHSTCNTPDSHRPHAPLPCAPTPPQAPGYPVTFGKCSAGPTTSRIVGLLSVGSVPLSCGFPNIFGPFSPGPGSGLVFLGSSSFSSAGPWHMALGRKLDRKRQRVCSIAAPASVPGRETLRTRSCPLPRMM